MSDTNIRVLHCEVVEEEVQLSLTELCRASDADPALVQELVAHGVIEAQGRSRRAGSSPARACDERGWRCGCCTTCS